MSNRPIQVEVTLYLGQNRYRKPRCRIGLLVDPTDQVIVIPSLRKVRDDRAVSIVVTSLLHIRSISNTTGRRANSKLYDKREVVTLSNQQTEDQHNVIFIILPYIINLFKLPKRLLSRNSLPKISCFSSSGHRYFVSPPILLITSSKNL